LIAEGMKSTAERSLFENTPIIVDGG